MEGEGQEDLIMCGDVRYTDDRRINGHGSTQQSTSKPFLNYSVCPRAGSQRVHKAATTLLGVYNAKDKLT